MRTQSTKKTKCICVRCGVHFQAYLSNNRGKTPRYCTRACYNTVNRRIPLAHRFWAKVQKTDTCWEWTGARQASGHGLMNSGGNGQAIRAHRVAYMLHYGDIPKGMEVCHHCDVPWCVNPAHLFLGTQADNLADMVAKGRHARGEKAGHARLTAEIVQEIRQRYANGGVTHRQLAEEYGVVRQTITDVVLRRRWKHID